MDKLAFLETAVEVLRILVSEPRSAIIFFAIFGIAYLVFSNRTVKATFSVVGAVYVFSFLAANGILQPLLLLLR